MDVAVVDDVPLFRLGVIAAVGRGSHFRAPAELLAWLTPGRACVALVPLGEADDEGWAVLADLRRLTEIRTVAILASFSEATAGRALRAGAVHVMPRDASPEQVRRVVDDAERGVVSLPVGALPTVGVTHVYRARTVPTDEELGWLRALSQGRTVALVAQDCQLSERVLYRRLRQLYRRLGVDNRTQAIVLGRDEGWL